MRITNEPVAENSPVKFTVTGFPEETAVKSAIERFYSLKTGADRNFLVFNAFNEAIMSGRVDEQGKIFSFTHNPRPSKMHGEEVK